MFHLHFDLSLELLGCLVHFLLCITAVRHRTSLNSVSKPAFQFILFIKYASLILLRVRNNYNITDMHTMQNYKYLIYDIEFKLEHISGNADNCCTKVQQSNVTYFLIIICLNRRICFLKCFYS